VLLQGREMVIAAKRRKGVEKGDQNSSSKTETMALATVADVREEEEGNRGKPEKKHPHTFRSERRAGQKPELGGGNACLP